MSAPRTTAISRRAVSQRTMSPASCPCDVVDHLEVVEIEVGDSERHAVALRAGQICVEQLFEQATVGQPGQRITQREAP